MSAVSVTVNAVKAESIGSRMNGDSDERDGHFPKENDHQDGSKTLSEARSEKTEESRAAEVVKMNSVDNEVKEGMNGRSQYHSIQRLLSPSSAGTRIQQLAVNGSVGGSQQSTVSGAAVRHPTSSSAANLMSGLIAGLFVDTDSVENSVGRPLEFLKDAIQQPENLQKAKAMASTVEGQRSTDRMAKRDWAGGSDNAKNGSGPHGMAERSVEVSTNDFMDSAEENEFSMKSPLTDLSNTSTDDEEEDMSDGEEILLNGNRRQRFQEEAEEDEEEEEEEEDMEVQDQGKSCGRDGGDAEVISYLEDGASGFSDSGSYGDSVEAKRARMESIVTNMKRSPSSTSNEVTHAERLRVVDPRRPKRKQYIPKQHDSCRSAQAIDSEPEMAAKKIRTSEKEELQQELCRMQERLADMRKKYFQIFGDAAFEKRCAEDDEEEEPETSEEEREKQKTRRINRLFLNGSTYPEQTSPLCADTPNELKHLAGLLKAEISNTVGTLVDEIVKNFLNRNRGQLKDSITSSSWRGPDSTANNTENNVPSIADKAHQDKTPGDQKEEVCSPQSDTKPLLLLPPFFSQNPVRSPLSSSSSLVLPQPVRPHPSSLMNDFSKVGVTSFSHLLPFSAPSKPLKSSKLTEKFMAPLFESHHIQRSPMPAIFPHPFFHHPPVMAAAAAAAVAAGMFAKEPEQTEALPLIVNTPTKKKRTKVTDTRLSPRAARAILQENGQTHQRQLQPYPAHMAEDSAGSKQNHPSSTQASTDRPNSNDTDQESFFATYHVHQQQHHHHHQHQPHPHHHVPHHHHPLIPVTLPTSVAIPNPSLRHSDIMQAIYGHRKHNQHCLELDLPTTSSSSPRAASQHRFDGSGLDRARALQGHMRSVSSSPEMAQTSSDGFSGSMLTKADSMDNYDSSIYDDQAMISFV